MIDRNQALLRLDEIRTQEANIIAIIDQAVRDLATTRGGRMECEYWLSQIPEEPTEKPEPGATSEATE